MKYSRNQDKSWAGIPQLPEYLAKLLNIPEDNAKLGADEKVFLLCRLAMFRAGEDIKEDKDHTLNYSTRETEVILSAILMCIQYIRDVEEIWQEKKRER